MAQSIGAYNNVSVEPKEGVEINVRGLKKYFKEIKAVDGVDLQVKKGELFGLLGPNGAGKSTMIRMLTTVLTPDAGTAIIAGLDLRKQRVEIRKLLGVCPQEIVIVETLTAEENVTFVAQMHGIPTPLAKQAASRLLSQLNIAGRKDRAKNFSGGMKRRLNLAMALIHNPKIIFLDEPTAGLDPQARRLVWDFIRDLKNTGSTIILTTHDMVEADVLSDHIAIIDQGKIIAQGKPQELKEKFGTGNILEIQFLHQPDLDVVKEKLQTLPFITKVSDVGEQRVLVSFSGGLKNFVATLQQGIVEHINEVENISFRQNTLEDVFLHLTGRRLRE
ncbi:MAG: multidrug ABC transporter, ATPase component [Promethearchaeota archaeon CR_4]|nr:MAG: multidrug ABC transporter, ATPase component [Candidatus Lokiarchaeota archaeon CR_4]